MKLKSVKKEKPKNLHLKITSEFIKSFTKYAIKKYGQKGEDYASEVFMKTFNVEVKGITYYIKALKNIAINRTIQKNDKFNNSLNYIDTDILNTFGNEKNYITKDIIELPELQLRKSEGRVYEALKTRQYASLPEVAEALGMQHNTVKQHVHNIKKAIAQEGK